MAEQPSREPPPTPPAGQANEPQPAGVDIERLAEKVYRLMLAELRLERDRGAATRRRRSDL